LISADFKAVRAKGSEVATSDRVFLTESLKATLKPASSLLLNQRAPLENRELRRQPSAERIPNSFFLVSQGLHPGLPSRHASGVFRIHPLRPRCPLWRIGFWLWKLIFLAARFPIRWTFRTELSSITTRVLAE